MTEAVNAFELKGTSFTLTVLKLVTGDLDLLRQGLEQKVAQAPRFFVHAPVVLDFSQIQETELDFSALKQLLQSLGLLPVGIAEASEAQQAAAWDSGLAIMHPARTPKPAPVAEPVIPEPAATGEPAMFINRPIRSGQQIYAKGRDLVVFGAVSPGAEVIADGDIHIYGALRGRAIAGASGDPSARICCLNLNPELVSINGNYWLSDQIPSEHWGGQASVQWDGSQLHIQSNA